MLAIPSRPVCVCLSLKLVRSNPRRGSNNIIIYGIFYYLVILMSHDMRAWYSILCVDNNRNRNKKNKWKSKHTLSSWKCKQFKLYVNKQSYDAKYTYNPIPINKIQMKSTQKKTWSADVWAQVSAARWRRGELCTDKLNKLIWSYGASLALLHFAVW